jgi:hypothetical protein
MQVHRRGIIVGLRITKQTRSPRPTRTDRVEAMAIGAHGASGGNANPIRRTSGIVPAAADA